jgi:hypothetical protein
MSWHRRHIFSVLKTTFQSFLTYLSPIGYSLSYDAFLEGKIHPNLKFNIKKTPVML